MASTPAADAPRFGSCPCERARANSRRRHRVNRQSGLHGIDCTAAARCIAVGALPFSRAFTLAEAWNGRAWRQLPPATPVPPSAYLYDVSCPQPTRCLAIGGYVTSSGAARALAELWNGQRWQVLRTPTT
jgi:hypothetical protein